MKAMEQLFAHISNFFGQEGLRNKILLYGSWSLAGIYALSKGDVLFLVSVITGLLAIVNYILQIRKNLKDK